MAVLVNFLLFVLSGAIVWFFAGRLIDPVDRVARRFRQSGYGALLYLIPTRSRPSVEDVVEGVAGNVLVAKTAYFSVLLGVPSSIIGLLVLSLGTNIPELVVAVRSVHTQHGLFLLLQLGNLVRAATD